MADERVRGRKQSIDFCSANDLRRVLSELDLDLRLLEPEDYDAAIIGVVELPWASSYGDASLVYDLDKVRRITRRLIGGTYEDADEWISFNVVGAFVGPGTPMFLRTIRSLRED